MQRWQPLSVGELVADRYEVRRELGRGGFAATYVVADRHRFNEELVLKELLPANVELAKTQELFEREARMLQKLSHPGVSRFHAYFVKGNRYYLVQDFVRGETLQALCRKGPLAESVVRAMLEELLEILHYLHTRDHPVIHRDIKPANIIRATSGHLHLIDFGAVKEALGQTNLDAHTRISTKGYAPPEQERGGRVVPASDLYALGATAVELLTALPPLKSYDVEKRAWSLESLRISPEFLWVLHRLLEESLTRRFRSAAEVLAALREPQEATMPKGTDEQPTHGDTPDAIERSQSRLWKGSYGWAASLGLLAVIAIRMSGLWSEPPVGLSAPSARARTELSRVFPFISAACIQAPEREEMPGAVTNVVCEAHEPGRYSIEVIFAKYSTSQDLARAGELFQKQAVQTLPGGGTWRCGKRLDGFLLSSSSKIFWRTRNS